MPLAVPLIVPIAVNREFFREFFLKGTQQKANPLLRYP